jgi:hypothetical protein
MNGEAGDIADFVHGYLAETGMKNSRLLLGWSLV